MMPICCLAVPPDPGGAAPRARSSFGHGFHRVWVMEGTGLAGSRTRPRQEGIPAGARPDGPAQITDWPSAGQRQAPTSNGPSTSPTYERLRDEREAADAHEPHRSTADAQWNCLGRRSPPSPRTSRRILGEDVTPDRRLTVQRLTATPALRPVGPRKRRLLRSSRAERCGAAMSAAVCGPPPSQHFAPRGRCDGWPVAGCCSANPHSGPGGDHIVARTMAAPTNSAHILQAATTCAAQIRNGKRWRHNPRTDQQGVGVRWVRDQNPCGDRSCGLPWTLHNQRCRAPRSVCWPEHPKRIASSARAIASSWTWRQTPPRATTHGMGSEHVLRPETPRG